MSTAIFPDKVVALLTLGYPKDKPGQKERKPLEEIVSFEVF
jgi:nitroreductase